jgi:hypothetical protein
MFHPHVAGGSRFQLNTQITTHQESDENIAESGHQTYNSCINTTSVAFSKMSDLKTG